MTYMHDILKEKPEYMSAECSFHTLRSYVNHMIWLFAGTWSESS